MAEMTWHTGEAGDELSIRVDHFDENMVIHETIVTLRIEPIDKPRTLTVAIDGKVVFSEAGGKQSFG